MTTFRFSLCLVGLWAGVVEAETPVTVPSGQPLALYDVVLEEEGAVARFLFHAPDIVLEGEGFTYADVSSDFAFLCAEIALPALTSNMWNASEIIVAMADRQVEFGQLSPDATQFFEAYTVQDGACIWRAF